MQQLANSLTAMFGVALTVAPVKPAFETRVYRDHWKQLTAKTTVAFGSDRRELKFSTYKGDSGLRTRASVSTVSEDGRSYAHDLLGDFSVVVLVDKTARGTEKAIMQQHAQALLQLDDLLAKVAIFYAAKAAKAAKAGSAA